METWLKKALSLVGTPAMLQVGGGIVVHGMAPLHHDIEHFAQQQGAFMEHTIPAGLTLVLGFIIGASVVALVTRLAQIPGVSPGLSTTTSPQSSILVSGVIVSSSTVPMWVLFLMCGTS
ncbi:DUF808 family protein, partial [Salmonella enterica]|uniref:DUF808 family protein n=1 Tax=Salmonella enterica TaxID=28901 RepID=UPI00398C2DFD